MVTDVSQETLLFNKYSLFGFIAFAIRIHARELEVFAVLANRTFSTALCLPLPAWLTCVSDTIFVR